MREYKTNEPCYVYNQYGDGVGALNYTIKSYHKKWNPNKSDNSYVGTGVSLDSDEQTYGSNARNAGGYSVSHIRATLIGKNAKTNEGYAGNVNLTNDTCLYSCIENDLQAVITPKKIKYVTGTSDYRYNLNDDIADSIWLFSNRELYETGNNSGRTTEGLGSSGVGYERFSNPESKYYIASYKNYQNTNKVFKYDERGYNTTCWLRSPSLSYTSSAESVSGGGNFSGMRAYSGETFGLAFGFCIQ